MAILELDVTQDTESTVPTTTPDADQPLSSEAPPAEPTTPPATDGGPSGEAKAEATTQQKATEPSDWRTGLDAADPEELRKHPKVAGIAGRLAESLAKKEAEKLREQIEAEVTAKVQADLDAKAEEDRLRKLKEEDPLGYLDEVDRKQAEKDAAEAKAREEAEKESKLKESTRGEAGAVVSRFQSKLPVEVQKQLSGKLYEGTWDQGYEAYLQDVVDLTMAHREAELKQKWEREELPNLKRRVLAEVNGDEPSPEVNDGKAAPPDDDANFLARFNAGDSSDYVRAMRLTGMKF